MVFTSYRFLFIFLPITFLGFYLLSRLNLLNIKSFNQFNHTKFLSLWLVLASIAFYAFWNLNDLLPLCTSVLVNYSIFRLMSFYVNAYNNGNINNKYYKNNEHYKQDKNIHGNNIYDKNTKPLTILLIGILFNIGFLSYYKYIHFFFDNFYHLINIVTSSLSSRSISTTAALTIPTSTTFINIPLGLSFYTFTQIAFLVDCYRNQYKKNDFLNYSLFVCYFPHLVCGPILSFKELYPQLIDKQKFRFSINNLNLFIFCFSIGLFKKAVIGDYLGNYVLRVFDCSADTFFDFKTVLLGTVSYSMQLYFDFSGYSDMAVGLSYLFGLKIPDNFNAPYQATSIIDFWRRWHISLSQFLKNYVYIPLGGNRGIKLNHYRNLWITMILGGLWHGASWTFIIWGVYHGLLLSINHLFRNFITYFHSQKSTVGNNNKKTNKLNENKNIHDDIVHFENKNKNLNSHEGENKTKIEIITKIKNYVSILFTFIFISLGWVLFRSSNFTQAINIYKSLFGWLQNVQNIDSTRLVTIAFEHQSQWQVLILALVIVFFIPDTLTLRTQLFAYLEKFNVKDNIQNTEKLAYSAIACAMMALVGLLCLSRVQYFLYSGF